MADTAEPTLPEQPGIAPEQPGIAKLKAEFLLKDYKPVLDTDYISSQVQEQLNDAREEERTAGQEPPTKRVKLKGRNKQRPKHKKIDSANKLCPAYINEEECRFGDKCKFSHDKKAFLESQPENVGSECYLFETYGKCPYGVTCRFSKSHLTEDLTNVAKDDITDYKQRGAQITNVLKKDLQVSLWKRRYDFSKADNVLDVLCPGAYDQRRRKEKPTGKDRKDKLPEQSHSSNTVGDGISDSKEVNTDQIQDKESNAKLDVANGNNLVDCDSKRDSDSVADATGETCDSGNTAVDRSSKETAKANDETAADKAVISETTDVGVENATTAEATLASHQQESVIRLRPQEKKKIDFKDKLYLAPLTTVGNLPFRRICKGFGADVTCGEMAVCTNLLQGQQSEWALLKRHVSEDLYGVQLCGAYPDSMTRCAQLITENMDVDFIDINCGCPIDLIFNKGEGSALMGRPAKFEQIVKGMTSVMDVPLTVKLRTGIYSDKSIAHTLMPKLRDWGVALTTLHGRSRVQRYTKTADWSYINECALAASPMPLFGNGDILSYEEAMLRKQETGVSGLMIARGALIKPWIFTEIKEQRHWDISSSERLDILREYCNFGFDHWGSDTQGVENTRRFLLEWLSFLYRYIPVGVLERVPQQINERPPYYKGRDDLETLMASPSCGDWIKISEMLLGPVPAGFTFLPKHKANAYK